MRLETLLDDVRDYSMSCPSYYFLFQLIDILTTKIYTVNRRLSGVVEIGDHDAKSRNILEKGSAQTGIVSASLFCHCL